MKTAYNKDKKEISRRIFFFALHHSFVMDIDVIPSLYTFKVFKQEK